LAAGGQANAAATAVAGNGGAANGAGFTAGSGAGAAVAATATGVTDASAIANATSGSGGAGSAGAAGGDGGLESLINAVSGTTQDGALTLQQTATGGGGGGSDNGIAGRGGDAKSELTLNDTSGKGHAASRAIDVTVGADGGQGGASNTLANDGAGGGAIADLSVVGANTVDASAGATGGWSHSAGGAATVNLNVTGATIHASGTAMAGGSDSQGAAAVVNASGMATSGDLAATASSAAQTQTTVKVPPLIAAISSATSLSLAGTAVTAVALAEYGIALPLLGSGEPNALAEATVAPPDVPTILQSNPAIAAAFGANPVIFDVGAIGGGGPGLQRGQTVSDTASVTINASTLGAPGNLVLGLYNGEIVGGAADAAVIVLQMREGSGATLLNETFTTLGQAFSSFNDSVASLANGGIGDSGQVQIDVTLTVKTDIAGDGFFGNLILGEAPKQQDSTAGWPRSLGEDRTFDHFAALVGPTN